ncbi:M24 family metallopeptidase [Rheinheimera sp.]|uniref:M24 family metallopeptidase n=1 Tax=Rheinheimera sp. TaxID=1869214 RepID=UPI00262D7AED|nr:M24 family metallopeptidase [Rheinheimera sp.]MCA1929540.1 aminopeptidase P family protein [Rheinheimera sp.]
MKTIVTTALLALMTITPTTFAAEFTQARQLVSADDFAVLAPRDRVATENRILQERLEALLPQLMAEAKLDMWLVINREYAEDPVYFTLVPQPTFAARRTTMLVFYRKADGSVERLSVNRYPFGAPYTSAWSGGDLQQQWQALAQVITERNPQRIGINVSTDWPVADGLTKAMHQSLLEVLPKDYGNRLVSSEQLVVRWMEQRTASELEIYPAIVSLARAVIAEAFSAKVITPGVTTTDDVAWYIRQRYESLGLPVWFMPDVNSQRQQDDCRLDSAFCGQSRVIHRGDVLHTDVGICYLKLCTDTQEMAYVLKVGEEQVPAGLVKALATGNQWQDILTNEFKAGRTGNNVLANTIKESQKQGMISSTYTHALGFVGHAPGPTIGMWDNQGPSAVGGQWPLYADTAYAIEGNIKQQVPEWGGNYVQIKLEQSAYFDGKKVIYLAGRQTQWHLVR